MLVLAIKPIKPTQIIPNTNYMLYSRIAAGLEATKPLKQAFLDNKCTFFDYETIRDCNGNGLVGRCLC